MKLQTKTQIAIGVTLIILILILNVTLRVFVSAYIDRSEEETVRNSVNRTTYALADELSSLSLLAKHWSEIEDLDVFRWSGKDRDSLQVFFSNETMQVFRLNLILIVRNNAELIYAKSYDYLEQKESPLSDTLRKRILPGSPLIDSTFAASGRTKILLLPEGPMMVMSHSINADKLHESKPGYLILGRYLLDAEIKSLSQRLNLTFALFSLNSSNLSDDLEKAKASLKASSPIFVEYLSEKRVAGYSILQDIYAQPALILKVHLTRDLHERLIVSLNYFMLMLVSVSMVFGLLIIWILRKLVLARLTHLNSTVKHITSTGELFTRISEHGEDELTDLSRAMNSMLNQLESSRKDILLSEEKYRQLFEGSLVSKYISSPEGKILLCNSTFARQLGFSSQEEAMKISAYTLYPYIESRERFVELLRTEKKIEKYETEFVSRNGKIITVLENAVGVFDTKGELVQIQGSFLDITDRKSTEQALFESEERFRMLYQQAPLAYQSLSETGIFIDVNQAWLDLLGYTRDEVLGRWFGDFVAPHDLDSFQKRFPRFLALGEIKDVEYDLVHKNGSILTAHLHGRIGHDEKGAFKQTHCILHDITDRKRTEIALRNSEEKYRSLLEATPDAIIMMDIMGNILWYNHISRELFNVSKNESLTGFKVVDLVVPDSYEKAKEMRSNILATGKHLKYELELRKLDGSTFLTETSAAPVRNASGEYSSFICIIRDISEQKKAHNALIQSEARYRGLVEASPDAIMLMDRQATIIWHNQKFAVDQGYSRENELVGRNASEFIVPEERARIHDETLKEWMIGEVRRFETEGLRGDGSRYFVELDSAPIRDKSGSISALIVIGREITARKKAERELYRLNRALRTISDCNQALVHAESETGLLNEICRIIVERGEYRMAWVGYIQNDELKTINPVTFAGHEEGFLHGIKASWGDNQYGQGVMGTCIRTRQPHFVRDITTDPSYEPWRKEALTRGYGSALGLPLIVNGEAIGALCIYSAYDAFDEQEVFLLSELTEDLAYGIQSLRTRAEHEKAEESLRESEENLRTLFETMTQGVLYVDNKGIVRNANPAACSVLRVSIDDLIGSNVSNIIKRLIHEGRVIIC